MEDHVIVGYVGLEEALGSLRKEEKQLGLTFGGPFRLLYVFNVVVKVMGGR